MSVSAPFSPCIVIPCFNHGQMMAAVLAALAGYGLPCLIVDDGSDPTTAQELQRLAAGLPWVMLLRLEQNQGKGAAVIAGLQLAQRQGYSHALQVDADGQHQLSDIPAMITEARTYPDCLISGRPVYDSSVPKARLYGRYVTHVWVWIETLSLSLKDSMCGFRVYPVAPTLALTTRQPLGKRMDFDTEVMVRLYWQGVASRFLPTRVTYPVDGVSHFDALRDNLRISWMHTRLFFGMLPRIPHLLRQRRRFAAPEHWSATQERQGLWGIRLMLRVYRLFGRRAFQLLLYPVIGYFWLTGRTQREASREYLQRLRLFAKSRQQPLPEPLDSFRHFMRFGDAMLNKLASWQGELRDIRLVNPSLCEHQIASGKGTLILASHLGDIESCRALGELGSGVTVNALVFTEHAERFNQLMKEVNPRANLNLISVTSLGPETAMRLQDKLDAGEWVAIVGDRTSAGKYQRGVQPRVVWSHFLDHPAPFPQGPFVLAAALRCPVFLMFGLKQQGHLNVYFEPFADPLILPRQQRQQALQEAVDQYAARLEHYCLLAPLDWFNFFDFWQLASQPSSQQRPET
ncbi:acyltransferase [Serratia grimesii]|uniref:Acyltransferase n=1 Tax=Serratia grimesii TaxID=82995 RepID=A0ABR4U6M9_9GAMM|nr:acyltransferase [Serratia grimesii]